MTEPPKLAREINRTQLEASPLDLAASKVSITLMEDHHHDAWRNNVREKIEETIGSCYKLITSEVPDMAKVSDFRNKCKDEVLAHLVGLGKMFGDKSQPMQIQDLTTHVNSFANSRRVQQFPHLLKSIKSLESLMSNPDVQISFNDIFDEYANDMELNALADQLINTLERLIKEGDGQMSARLDRDLRKLLDQIQGRKPTSLSQLAALSEVIGRLALEAAGQKLGIPAGSLLMDAAKIAWKIQGEAVRRLRENQNEYIRLLDIKSAGPDLRNLPALDEKVIERFEAEALPGSAPGPI